MAHIRKASFSAKWITSGLLVIQPQSPNLKANHTLGLLVITAPDDYSFAFPSSLDA
jgi:hypothetical protein